MAGINLTPQVPVILGQAFVFALAYMLVKRLIMEPYAALRKRRESVTQDVVYDVTGIYSTIEERRLQMKEDREATLAVMQQQREEARQAAYEEAKQIVTKSQQEADDQVASHASKVAELLSQEKPAGVRLAQSLAGDIWQQVLSDSR
ncbi:MAG: hypothetical protein OXC44_02930 [Proteobacteria bacterium]|nr:hypothetical protein [Pseudomonadota bacterium]